MEIPQLVISLVNASLDAAAVVDRELVLRHCNAAYMSLAGLRPRLLAAQQYRGMCHECFGLTSCDEGCIAGRALQTGKPCRVDEVCATKLSLQLIVLAVPILDDAGQVAAVLEQYRDITAESRIQEGYRRLLEQEREQTEIIRRQKEELRRSNDSLRLALGEVTIVARTDVLTGVANRRYFEEWLNEQLGRAGETGRPISLILFDLDHFKKVNDIYGHAEGDRVLSDFARSLRSSARDYDLVARIGGEEFVLVLPGASSSEAERVARRVREQMERSNLRTTASGGIASFPADAATASLLLLSADRALYQAKRDGRDRVVTFESIPQTKREFVHQSYLAYLATPEAVVQEPVDG